MPRGSRPYLISAGNSWLQGSDKDSQLSNKDASVYFLITVGAERCIFWSVTAHIWIFYIRERVWRCLQMPGHWKRSGYLHICNFGSCFHATCCILDGEDHITSEIICSSSQCKRYKGRLRLCLWAEFLLPTSFQSKSHNICSSAHLLIR